MKRVQGTDKSSVVSGKHLPQEASLNVTSTKAGHASFVLNPLPSSDVMPAHPRRILRLLQDERAVAPENVFPNDVAWRGKKRKMEAEEEEENRND